MAEPAGLVLGAASILSLFTTCIDLLDRCSLALRHEEASQLAIDKLKLLRLRLTNWGRQTGVCSSGCGLCPAYEYYTAPERDVVTRGLAHITKALQDATLLEEKHGPPLKPQVNLKAIHTRDVEAVVTKPRRIPSLSASWRSSINLRNRAQWALHDKQKFDNLTQDVAFLIENLEKVTVEMSASKRAVDTVFASNQPLPDHKRHEISYTSKSEKSNDISAASNHRSKSRDQSVIHRVGSAQYDNVFRGTQLNDNSFGSVGHVSSTDNPIGNNNLFEVNQNNCNKSVAFFGMTSSNVVKCYTTVVADEKKNTRSS